MTITRIGGYDGHLMFLANLYEVLSIPDIISLTGIPGLCTLGYLKNVGVFGWCLVSFHHEIFSF